MGLIEMQSRIRHVERHCRGALLSDVVVALVVQCQNKQKQEGHAIDKKHTQTVV